MPKLRRMLCGGTATFMIMGVFARGAVLSVTSPGKPRALDKDEPLNLCYRHYGQQRVVITLVDQR